MLQWFKYLNFFKQYLKQRMATFQLTGCDIYRDGGSCSVSFVDEKSETCELMFPIKVVGLSKKGLETDGHRPPVLTRYVQVKRISHATGLVNFDTNTQTEHLTWKDAQVILGKLASQVEHLDSECALLFLYMVEIANGNGLNKNT